MTSCATRRRALGLLAALLFGLSAVTHAYAMTHAAIQMAPVGMATSMPDDGMDCAGGDQAARAACLAACATAFATLCEPVRLPSRSFVQHVTLPPPEHLLGRGILPELRPPKRVI